ncbi:hypothetical protein NC652_006065 [Populus alba x Populus x berolinensis]|nr:hypothetical protein NC652_006065 [Populus alba x Populus x berolinensis]
MDRSTYCASEAERWDCWISARSSTRSHCAFAAQVGVFSGERAELWAVKIGLEVTRDKGCQKLILKSGGLESSR